jgi:hypothetical protein
MGHVAKRQPPRGCTLAPPLLTPGHMVLSMEMRADHCSWLLVSWSWWLSPIPRTLSLMLIVKVLIIEAVDVWSAYNQGYAHYQTPRSRRDMWVYGGAMTAGSG